MGSTIFPLAEQRRKARYNQTEAAVNPLFCPAVGREKEKVIF